MGNICRSPTAEGCFRKLIADNNLSDKFYLDSAGTHDYHVGQPPDSTMQQTTLESGFDISDLIARQVTIEDFNDFDYIIAMDNNNIESLAKIAPKDKTAKVELFLNYATTNLQEVPDPYYGNQADFFVVVRLVQQASLGFLREFDSSRFSVPSR